MVTVIGSAWLTASAQRPMQIFDPFYHGETAERVFFDRYAVTGELSYRPAGLLRSDNLSSSSVPTTAIDPFGLSLNLDYRLASGFNLGFFVDASGNTASNSLSLSWVTLKYFRRQENTDYAIRLAVDPSRDGRSGFPQTDLAFLYASSLSPTLRSDFGVGIRRVQIGFQQIVPTDAPPIDPDAPIVSQSVPDREILRSRALGWEVHMMSGYSLLFDPAGSNLFFSFIGEGGQYDLVEWTVANAAAEETERTTTKFNGGVIWVRSGLEFDRPGYQISPFLSLPLKQWAPSGDDYPKARAHIGLRLMIR
ncbi:MAG: hypothetical protein BMS9Abin05_0889 [Rhodothermia bacterium]|nr:MAG: hypothetical protein BMS9Abin05_0889 [Rhodothermia bacterium]